MNHDLMLTNARIVLEVRVAGGALRIVDGRVDGDERRDDAGRGDG